MKYRAEIDGLRAIAVLSVILFHSGVSFLPGGFVGVDVFFVISGYLITAIIIGQMKEQTFSRGRFLPSPSKADFACSFRDDVRNGPGGCRTSHASSIRAADAEHRRGQPVDLQFQFRQGGRIF